MLMTAPNTNPTVNIIALPISVFSFFSLHPSNEIHYLGEQVFSLAVEFLQHA
jgi:hypothetical protein